MASTVVSKLLLTAWQERWTVKDWTAEVSQSTMNLKGNERRNFNLQLTAAVIQYSLSSPTPDGVYYSYLKDSLATEHLSTADVLDYISKMDINQNMKELKIALTIFEDAMVYIRPGRNAKESFNLAVCIAKSLCWLLGTTATVLKNIFKAAKEDSQCPDIQLDFGICDKCFELVSRIMDTTSLQSLALIGKLEIQAEQEGIIQAKLNEIITLPIDSLNDQNISQQYQSSLKGLMNDAARFLNSTFHGVLSQNRIPGYVPSHTLQTLVEIQVIENFYMDSIVMADLFDSVLRSENIPMDQFYVDILRCSCHGILNASNMQEELFWSSFVFFKIPSIVSCLRLKYKQTGIDNTVFFTACKQFASMNILLDDLDVHCRFECLPNFLTQCQYKGLFDGDKVDQIMSQRVHTADLFEAGNSSDRNPVKNVLSAAHLITEILKVLSLPWEENKDAIKQNLSQLSNSSELGRVLAAAAGMDQLSTFLELLISLNENSKGPISEPNEDPAFAEVRADIFNFSFLLLSYITALFGVKVLSMASKKDSFFVTWRMNCSEDVGQKKYSPMALEMILDQVMTNSAPNINAVLAKWNDYCLCSGAVIKELTQALACSAIVVDKLQKVCETFKNKRPALSICASSWLCTQYTSMIASKRDMTLKILRAFRGHASQRPARSEYMARIIEDLAGSIGLEQQTITKGKTAGKPDINQRAPSESPSMAEILRKMTRLPGSPCIDKKSLTELKKCLDVLSHDGFCKVLIMVSKNKQLVNIAIRIQQILDKQAILNSGKIDEARAFEVLASTLILLDPIKLVLSLISTIVPAVIRRCDAFTLLSDPQGHTLAKFVSKSICYALILSKAQKVELERPRKISKLDISSDVESNSMNRILNSLASLIEDILNIVTNWEPNGSIALFLKSLLEQLCIATMHISPALRLPQELGVKILKLLPGELPNEILMLICNIEDECGREQLAHRIAMTSL